jgi:uncharacterized spore protein YtfJ
MNEDADFSPMDEELELVEVEPAVDFMQTTMEYFLDAASVDAVYGQPIENGDTLIVPSAEVLAVMGFGVGSGSGTGGKECEEDTGSGRGSGGGGGGRVLSRPVAVIISSPEGVRVEPVVDVTKIGLAALTAGAFVFGTMLRLFNPRATMKELKDL